MGFFHDLILVLMVIGAIYPLYRIVIRILKKGGIL